MTETPCPSAEDLRLALDGAPSSADVLVHVDACLDCQAILERWTAGAAVGEELRHADGGAGDPFEPPAGYEHVREIRRGGQGVVFEARRRDDGERVAIKMELSGPWSSPTARRRFEREASLLRRLVHEGIAEVLESGANRQGTSFLATRFVDGSRLDDWLDAHPELDSRARLELFLAIADAIEAAHGAGVLHRDLKPSNVLVGRDGLPKVIDFGLGKALVETAGEEASELTRTGVFFGSVGWAAPEQLRGEDRDDPRADVFGLGLLLYRILTGRSALPDTGSIPEVLAVIEGRRIPVLELRDGDRWLRAASSAIVVRALEPRAEDRYRGVAQLADDVRRCLEGRAVRARRWSARIRAFALRRPAGLAGLVLGAAVVSGAVAYDLGADRRWWQRMGEVQRVHLRSPSAADWPAAEDWVFGETLTPSHSRLGRLIGRGDSPVSPARSRQLRWASRELFMRVGWIGSLRLGEEPYVPRLMDWSTSGNRIAVGLVDGRDSVVHFVDPVGPRVLDRRWTIEDRELTGLRLDPTGRYAGVVADGSRDVRILDLEDPSVELVVDGVGSAFDFFHEGCRTELVHLSSAGGEGAAHEVVFTDLPTLEPSKRNRRIRVDVEAQGAGTWTLGCSSEPPFVAVGLGRKIALYELGGIAASEEVLESPRTRSVVVCISPDGSLVSSGPEAFDRGMNEVPFRRRHAREKLIPGPGRSAFGLWSECDRPDGLRYFESPRSQGAELREDEHLVVAAGVAARGAPLAASIEHDRTLRIFDPTGSSWSESSADPRYPAESTQALRSGELGLVTADGGRGTMSIWRGAANEPEILEVGPFVTGVDLCPVDPNLVAVVTAEDGAFLARLDSDDGRPERLSSMLGSGTYSIRFSSGGDYLATGDGDGRLWLFERVPDARPARFELRSSTAIFDLRLGNLDWHPSEDLLAFGGGWGRFGWFDVDEGRALPAAHHPGVTMMGVSFSPDGSTCASVSGTRLFLWPARSPAPSAQYELSPGETLYCVKYHPSEPVVLLGTDHGVVICFDLEIGAPIARLPVGEGQVLSLDVSPDGTELAVGCSPFSVVRVRLDDLDRLAQRELARRRGDA